MDIQPTTTPLTPEQADLRELRARLARVLAVLQDPLKATEGQVRGKQNYRYADLADCLKAVRPLLSAEGLALCQPMRVDDDVLTVATQVSYGLAQESSQLSAPAAKTMQDLGAQVTYLRRYTLCALLAVQGDEADPDKGPSPEPSERKERIRQEATTRAQQEPQRQGDDLGPLLAQTLRMLGDMAVRNDYAIDKRAALQACLDKRGWPEPTRERLESLQAALLDPSKEEALMKIIKPHLSQRQTQREATQVEVERAAAAWAEANMMHNVVEDYYVRDMITALATDLGQDLGAMTPKAWAVQLARFQDPKQTPTLQALFAGVFVPF